MKNQQSDQCNTFYRFTDDLFIFRHCASLPTLKMLKYVVHSEDWRCAGVGAALSTVCGTTVKAAFTIAHKHGYQPTHSRIASYRYKYLMTIRKGNGDYWLGVSACANTLPYFTHVLSNSVWNACDDYILWFHTRISLPSIVERLEGTNEAWNSFAYPSHSGVCSKWWNVLHTFAPRLPRTLVNASNENITVSQSQNVYGNAFTRIVEVLGIQNVAYRIPVVNEAASIDVFTTESGFRPHRPTAYRLGFSRVEIGEVSRRSQA